MLLVEGKSGHQWQDPKSIWVLAPQLVSEFPDTTGERIIGQYVYMSAWANRTMTQRDCPVRMPDLYSAGYLGGTSPSAPPSRRSDCADWSMLMRHRR